MWKPDWDSLPEIYLINGEVHCPHCADPLNIYRCDQTHIEGETYYKCGHCGNYAAKGLPY